MSVRFPTAEEAEQASDLVKTLSEEKKLSKEQKRKLAAAQTVLSRRKFHSRLLAAVGFTALGVAAAFTAGTLIGNKLQGTSDGDAPAAYRPDSLNGNDPGQNDPDSLYPETAPVRPAAPVVSIPAAPLDLAKITQRPFVFADYKIDSAHGVELKRHFRPENRKNIIYILDYHAGGNGFDGVMFGAEKTGLIAQQHIFRLLEEEITKYGRIHLLHESWSKDDNETAEQNLERNLAESMLLGLYRMEDIRDRHAQAREVLGQSLQQATSLITVIYKDNVVPIYPQNLEQEKISIRMDLTNAVLNLLNLNSDITCQELGFKADLTTSEATAALDFVDIKPEEKKCGCAILNKEMEAQLEWTKYRGITVAEREIAVALKSNSDTVYIVAGQLHADRALKYAEAHGANYIVISPADMPESFRRFEKSSDLSDRPAAKRIAEFCGKTDQVRSKKLNALLERKLNTGMEKIDAVRRKVLGKK